MEKPRFLDDEVFKALRAGEIDTFHKLIADSKVVDLSGVDLRGTDLRNADLSKVILRGSYLKDADLRGCDLRRLDLEGCSIHGAKIGGTYFPANITAAELQLSIDHGTRLRTVSVTTP